jgi:nucleotide-binding universal stress UspA family protein
VLSPEVCVAGRSAQRVLTKEAARMTTPPVDPHRIVVGVDGSPPSDDALRWGRFLTESIGGTLQAVFAWPSIAEWASPWAPDEVAVPWELDPGKDAARFLDQTLDRVFGDDRPAKLQATVAEGSPTKALLQISEGARMLVVGSRGHGGFTGLLLGSVSTACTEHARCPVLVVHGLTPPPR